MTLSNPMLGGFHPDPSVVEAKGWYYLATSTFEYLPGIPIHRSRDFVHWELIGHVVTRTGQLGVAEVRTGGGAWAPTLRYREGMFHVVVTDAMGRGMLHFTACDPAGPWSDGDVILRADGRGGLHGIDPDIAWDGDGNVYITFSGLVLSGPDFGKHLGIQQVRVDLDRHRALEKPRSLWSGTGLMFPEAPHLYQVTDTWYLMIAEGGTERGHAISLARSSSPEGPFEGNPDNPVVSARSTARSVQNTGHGDLVVGPDDRWWCVMLGTRPLSKTRAFSALGRETFVSPVTWADGWPRIAPVELAPAPGTQSDLDFDGPLDDEWIAVRRLPSEIADLRSCPGVLILLGEGTTLGDSRPVFVGRRQPHLTHEVTVTVETTDGIGGLATRFDEYSHVEVEVRPGVIVARAVSAGLTQEWFHPYRPAGAVDLHLDAVPGEDLGFGRPGDIIRLAATVDGERIVLAEVDGRHLSTEITESFTGRVTGVYAVEGEILVHRWFSRGHD